MWLQRPPTEAKPSFARDRVHAILNGAHPFPSLIFASVQIITRLNNYKVHSHLQQMLRLLPSRMREHASWSPNPDRLRVLALQRLEALG